MILMDTEKTPELVKEAISQVTGKKFDGSENGYLATMPTQEILDIGKSLAEAEATTEKMAHALVSVMGSFEVMTMGYEMIYKSIVVDRVNWGGFKERAKVDLADIIEDPMLNLINGKSYADIEHTYFAPKVRTKIYDEMSGVMVPTSMTIDILKEAFNSIEQMNAFRSALRERIRETRDAVMDMYAEFLVQGAIAVSCLGTNTKVPLRTLAVADGVNGVTSSDTKEQLESNKDFMIWARKKIATIIDNMRVRSNAYNNGSISVTTVNPKKYFITPFAKAMTSGILATSTDGFKDGDSFLGEYETIPSWQATRDSDNNKFDYDTVTSIRMSADPNNKLGLGTSAISIDNVVGVVFHEKAIGLTNIREKVTSNYTSSADFWNEFLHLANQCILDSDFPIVAFTLD